MLVMGLFILLALGEYLVLKNQTQTDQYDGYLINRTGYQRMLSQRIALLSTKLVYEADRRQKSSLKKQLLVNVGELEAWHDALISKCNERTKRLVTTLYFEAPVRLNSQIKTYTQAVKTLAIAPDTTLNPQNPAYLKISQISINSLLLQSINQVVGIFEKDNYQSHERVNNLITTLILVNILILFLTWQFILQPLIELITEKQKMVEKSHNETQLLQEIILETNQAENLSIALKIVLSKLCEITGWAFGQSWLPSPSPSPEGRVLEYASAWFSSENNFLMEFHQDNKTSTFSPGVDLPGQAWSSKKTLWIDIDSDAQFERIASAKKAGLRTVLNIPVLANNEVVCILEFFLFETCLEEQKWTEFISTVCTQLGGVIQKKKMEEALQHAYHQLNNRLEEQSSELEAAMTLVEKSLSSRKQLKLQLAQSDKLATVGQLAAGVAHEINNPVGFVKSNLETMTDYVQVFTGLIDAFKILITQTRNHTINLEETVKILEKIETLDKQEDFDFISSDIHNLLRESIEGTVRIQEIVRDLKSFARVDTSEFKASDINEGIETTLKIAWNELKYKCKINKHLGKLPLVDCNLGQLNQVFINLLINAAHAVEEEGEITITTEADETNVCIRIEDTGKGIAREHLSQIFDPFFTTKPVGIGTGLGLSISYGIIQKHKGTIDVFSTVGKGTAFVITLPIHGEIAS